MSQNDQARKQRHLQEQALRGQQGLDRERDAERARLAEMIHSRDYAGETGRAMDTANQLTGLTIEKALRRVAGEYTPGMSSEFGVHARAAVEDASHPQWDFLTRRAIEEGDRRIADQALLTSSVPGQVADTYWRAAQQPQANYSGPLSAFMQAWKAYTDAKHSGDKPGAGGRGDFRTIGGVHDPNGLELDGRQWSQPQYGWGGI
jgi:hypothetical protein